MRILCLTPRLPFPPDRGDRLRAFRILEAAASEHQLSLASFIADEGERRHLEALRPLFSELRVVRRGPRLSAAATAANLWRRQPLQSLYYRSREMRRTVREMAAATAFDAVYVHLFRMAQYAAELAGPYRIVDLTDVISAEIARSLPYRGPLSRLVYTLERPRVERAERWVAQHFEESWLISEADREILAGRCPEAELRVVPNGVDLDALRPTGEAPVAGRLVFVGHLRVPHNVDAALVLARQVLPLVQRDHPGATLEVVGADPAPEVLDLTRDPAVRVPGFVPELNPVLNRAAVFVAPLRFAAGVQNKVLEAMAAGRPVVTTTLVNAGLGAAAGEEVVVADTAEATAREVSALLADADRRSRIGAAARRFVATRFSWSHAVDRLAEIERRLGAAGFSAEP